MTATTLNGVLLTGNHAGRPAATAVAKGTLYACSTHTKLYQSDAASWSDWFASAAAGGGELVSTSAIWTAAGQIAVATGSGTATAQQLGLYLPWHIPILPTIYEPDATVGTWALSSAAESAGDYGFYKPGSTANSGGAQTLANAGSNAQNDACSWDIVLGAGTWDFYAFVRKSTNTAIITLLLDGVSKGTVDTYAAAAAAARVSITGWTTTTTGKQRLQVKAATRNASNSTGWVLNFASIYLHRTA